MINKYEMMLRVAADSPATLSPSSYQRYLEECHNAGYNLDKARSYIESRKDLNPYTRSRMDAIYMEFLASLVEDDNRRECPYCDGAKQFEDGVVCDMCDGRGWIEDEGDY